MTRLTYLLLVLTSACVFDASDGDDPHARPDAAVPAPDAPDGSGAPDAPGGGLQPSNDLGAIEPTGLAIAPPNGRFSTDLECLPASALGRCEVQLHGGAETCVCRMDTLDVGDLRVVGHRALAILAHDRVSIHGTLDVSADGSIAGPGASSAYATSAPSRIAGAGGSHGSAGAGTDAAVTYGAVELVPMRGGMRGRDASGAAGGGGGGALQITAAGHISVDGIIDASGGGGTGGVGAMAHDAGAGGGAGGAILLEAPRVIVAGAIVANGGGGGGGGGGEGPGAPGSDGGRARAAGGAGHDGEGCPLYGYVAGGDGGAGATVDAVASVGQAEDTDDRCIGSTSFVGAGGGGGGLGRIRINTTTGCSCGGTVSPAPSYGVFP